MVVHKTRCLMLYIHALVYFIAFMTGIELKKLILLKHFSMSVNLNRIIDIKGTIKTLKKLDILDISIIFVVYGSHLFMVYLFKFTSCYFSSHMKHIMWMNNMCNEWPWQMKSFIVLAAQNTCSNIKVIAIFYKYQSHANRLAQTDSRLSRRHICRCFPPISHSTSHTIRIDLAIIAK